MIKENQRLLNQVNIVLDGVIVYVCLLLAWFIRFRLLDGVSAFPFTYFCTAGVAIALCYVLVLSLLGLYESHRTVRLGREMSRVFAASCIGGALLASAAFGLKLVDISRGMLIIFFLGSTLGLMAKRAALRLVLHHFRAKGFNLKHVILVGSGPLGAQYVEKARSRPDAGLCLAGCVADGSQWGLPLLGSLDGLKAVLELYNPDEVVAALSAAEFPRLGEIIAACEDTGCKLSIIPFYAEYLAGHPQLDELDGLQLINLRRIPLDNWGNAFLKRAMDVVGSALLLVLTSPILLFAAIGVKITSPGPVIFAQERVGRNKKPFVMYKFRSMRVNARSQSAWSTDYDDRRTKFGSFLRKCSIDELPQLWNVLKGDMSLVGPRPELPHFVDVFKEEVPLYMVKHQVRPGITGWAQVNGFRGDTSIPERIRHDIWYIENWTLWLDVKILLMTALGGWMNQEKLTAGKK